MSLPKDKLNKLMKEIELLPDSDAEQVVIIIEDFIKSKKKKPSDYFGFLSDLDIDVDEESRKLRSEWDRDIS